MKIEVAARLAGGAVPAVPAVPAQLNPGTASHRPRAGGTPGGAALEEQEDRQIFPPARRGPASGGTDHAQPCP
jgi:hypothetical protein